MADTENFDELCSLGRLVWWKHISGSFGNNTKSFQWAALRENLLAKVISFSQYVTIMQHHSCTLWIPGYWEDATKPNNPWQQHHIKVLCFQLRVFLVTQFKISSVVNATLLLQDGFVIVPLLCSGPLLWFWFIVRVCLWMTSTNVGINANGM